MKESEKNKRKQNTLPEKLGIIMSVFSAINDVFFGISGLQFGILNIIIFILSAIVLLVIWIWLTVSFYKKEKEKEARYKCQKEQYIENCNENAGIKEIYREVEKNDEKYAIKRKGEIRCYIIITIMLGIGIIFNCSMTILQYDAMRGAKEKEETVTGINASSNENTNTIANTIVNEAGGNKGITPEEKEEMKNKTFILSDPERLRVLSKEDEERVFYVTMDQEKLEEEVEEHINSIYDQKKKSTFLENSTEERLAANAQGAENIFLHAIDQAKKYRTQENYEGWKSVIPNSNTLENIMDDREFLLTPAEEDTEDMEFDGVLCFRLANNNQLLADEYKRQGGKPETVVYYYVEAIKKTEDGLAYEDLPQGYKTTYYGYLKARYKDIADYIENNLDKFGAGKEKYQQLMEKANAIYKMM